MAVFIEDGIEHDLYGPPRPDKTIALPASKASFARISFQLLEASEFLGSRMSLAFVQVSVSVGNFCLTTQAFKDCYVPRCLLRKAPEPWSNLLSLKG